MRTASERILMWQSTSESMTDPTRGLLDTSVVIDHDVIDHGLLPDHSAIAAITLAELAAGPHATDDKEERARRQDRLQWATATWDPLPFDAEAARMYGRMFAAARAAGQKSRSRLADLLVASTAAANSLPVYTRNPSDFDLLKGIIKVVPI
jgi:predicted nucleic acid-binding protein